MVVALGYPGVIFLVGSTGDVFKRIDIGYDYIQWSPDGCQLRITTRRDQKSILLNLDLASGVQHDLFVVSDTGDEDAMYPQLSPDGKWISYVVGYGEDRYTGWEFQDVRVVVVDEPARPFHLTERGGAGVYGGAWSPDGQWLAYSDYDQDGNGQLYLSKPDGSDRRQLTHLVMSKITMDVIEWSPDGQRLAFTAYDQDDIPQGIWIVHSDGNDLREITLSDGNSIWGAPLWWSADGRTFVAFVSGDESVEGLYWFDPDTGKPYHVFYDSKSPNGHISFCFPISDVQTIAFSDAETKFYTYHLTDGTIDLWLDETKLFPEEGWPPMLWQVVPVPGGAVDISQCPSK